MGDTITAEQAHQETAPHIDRAIEDAEGILKALLDKGYQLENALAMTPAVATLLAASAPR